ncbi:type III PLP-dependent enzyme [Acetobacter papayae]|uniref:type III PLP-dependent enzyme n=1 Tax=Acetobacter papayae TaxID=1076592 RepID=UPI00046EB546|nr:type III PLP-dependent enzyme [Acetobacter papayae]
MERRNFLRASVIASVASLAVDAVRVSEARAAVKPLTPPTLSEADVAARLHKLRTRNQRACPPTKEVMTALQRIPNSVLLYDLDQVEQNYLTFLEAEPGVEVFYAVKCAPNPRILQRLAAAGSGFDIASRAELDLALATGVVPTKCIFSNTVKPVADIRYAFDHGVKSYVADSRHEVEKLAKHAPGTNLYVRISVDSKFASHPLGDKFGTTPEHAKELLLLGRKLGLKPYGTHFHVGTQCLYPQAWETPTAQAASIFRDMKKHGIDLQFFDIGGGYPTAFASSPNPPSVKQILDTVKTVLDRELPGQNVRLAVEPGRGIAGSSGTVSARVMLRADRASGEWLHLDAGIYQGLFDAVDHYVYEIATPGRSGAPVPFTLCGPTCDSFDTISKNQKLPGDLQEGDLLIFENAAAYSESCNTTFNGMPSPAVHYLDELLPI